MPVVPLEDETVTKIERNTRMEPIRSFNRESLHIVKTRIEETFKQLSDEFGLQFTLGNGRYNPKQASYRFEIATIDETGEAITKERDTFNICCTRHGLVPEDFGQEFELQGERFVITGWSSRRSKYPLSANRVKDGKGFKFPLSQVKRIARQLHPENQSAEIW